MNKVEGKVSDWCPKCKNCKGTTQESNGVHVWLTEVECEDPYDGMTKTLTADSDIRCSMFEPKPPCEKSERFDGTYCHGPNGTITISYKAVFGEPVNCPSYEEKKEKEPCDKISCLQHELEMDKLRMKIHQLEKEKAAHMKGIERLKKSQEKLQNQVKNLQTTNEESYKREEKLEEELKEANKLADSWKRDYEFVRNQLIHPIYDILYPGNLNRDINVTDFINNVKNLKIEAEENETMYNDLKYWRERCHGAETDVTTLNSKVETLKNKKDKMIGEKDKQIEELTRRYNMIAKKLNDIHDILKEDPNNA